jgi:hypothetical protein
MLKDNLNFLFRGITHFWKDATGQLVVIYQGTARSEGISLRSYHSHQLFATVRYYQF